jgi:hypothetical protein
LEWILQRPAEYAVAYAVSYLVSAENRNNVVLSIAADDRAKVYLNGREVYRSGASHPWVESFEKVTGLSLVKGVNTVFLKIVNGQHDWRASLAITDEGGKPPKSLQFTVDPADSQIRTDR